MYHIIYKTKSNSGKYYIGRHSTKNLDDGYLGSGKWVRSIKDKSLLSREILEYCISPEDLLLAEEKYLKEHVGKENCMNFNLSSIGFSTGELNPANNDEERLKRSIRFMGDKNPAKRPEVRKKMSESQKGKQSPNKGKKLSEQARKKISESRRGLVYSEEGKKKLSESRKRNYDDGKRGVPSFSGHTHSEETKQKQSDAAKNRDKLQCPHCNIFVTKANLIRWHLDKCKNKALLSS